MLDDVHAAAVGTTGIAPGHAVMAHRAAALLQEPALDGEAGILVIKEGIHLLHRLAVEELRIHAVDAHGIAAPGEGIALGIGVAEVQHAALRDHGVEVEVLLEVLPQLHRPFIERVVAGQHVVGADDRGVAADVAGAEPALFEDRDVFEAVFLGKIIGRRQPMAAAADDDDVIFLLGNRIAPGGLPVLVAGKGILDEREYVVAHALVLNLG